MYKTLKKVSDIPKIAYGPQTIQKRIFNHYFYLGNVK